MRCKKPYRSSECYYLILLFGALILASCDGLLLGLVDEGGPVQLHVALADSGNDSTLAGANTGLSEYPTADYVEIRLTEATIGDKMSDRYSFELMDSTVVLSVEGEAHYLAEKFIPEGVYGDLQVLVGDRSGSHAHSVEISGQYQGEPYTILVDTLLELHVEIKPPINIGRMIDTLTVLTLVLDRSEWFIAPDGKTVIDPLDDANSKQILSNIVNSVRPEKFLTEDDKTNRSNGNGNRDGGNECNNGQGNPGNCNDTTDVQYRFSAEDVSRMGSDTPFPVVLSETLEELVSDAWRYNKWQPSVILFSGE